MAESYSELRVVLVLDHKEALWLRSALQNPLNGSTPLDEPADERRLREAIHTALYKETQ